MVIGYSVFGMCIAPHHVDPATVSVGDAMPIRDVRFMVNSVAFGGDYDAYCNYSLCDVVTPDSAWVAVDMGDLGWRVVSARMSFQQASAFAGELLEAARR